MELVKRSVQQIVSLMGGLSPRGKASAGATLLALLGGGVALVTYARSVDYAVLYSGLQQADMARVVEDLRGRQVPFQLSRGGGTVSVPWDAVPELRLELAADGALRGAGAGLELFERGTFGQSEFAEQVTYTRALQGELARTISGLDPVERAMVHLGRPRPSVFVSADKPASGSVVLRLHPGRMLSPRQIAGIRELVAASVEGLEAARVSIIDNSGSVLAGSDLQVGPDESGLGLERERAQEVYLTRKAQTLLDTAFGPRRAIVRVNARLTREKFEERREVLDGQGVPRSERLTSRTSVSGPQGAAAGTTANTPDRPAAQGGRAERQVEESETTEYEIGRSTQVVVREAGAIERLTVGLLLDEELAENASRIEGIVKEAVGFDPSRGDTMEVSALPFHDGLLDEAEASFTGLSDSRLSLYLRHGLVALALLVATGLGGLALRKLGNAVPAPVRDAEGVATTPDSPEAASAAQAQQAERGQHLRDEAAREVAADPAQAGRILEWWLGGDTQEHSASEPA